MSSRTTSVTPAREMRSADMCGWMLLDGRNSRATRKTRRSRWTRHGSSSRAPRDSKPLVGARYVRGIDGDGGEDVRNETGAYIRRDGRATTGDHVEATVAGIADAVPPDRQAFTVRQSAPGTRRPGTRVGSSAHRGARGDQEAARNRVRTYGHMQGSASRIGDRQRC